MNIYPKYRNWAYSNILKHDDLFKLLSKLDVLADKVSGAKPERFSDKNEQALLEAIAFTIFVPAHLSFQSGCLLTEFGYPTQGLHLARAIFEARVDFLYLLSGTEEETYRKAKRCANYEGAYRHEFLVKTPGLSDGFPGDSKEEYKSFLKKFRDEFPDGDMKHWSGLTIMARLEKLNAKQDYEVYRLLSQGPHASPMTWHSFMKETDQGLGFLQGPTNRNLHYTGLDLANFFLDMVDGLTKLFKLDQFNQELVELRQDLEKNMLSPNLESKDL